MLGLDFVAATTALHLACASLWVDGITIVVYFNLLTPWISECLQAVNDYVDEGREALACEERRMEGSERAK